MKISIDEFRKSRDKTATVCRMETRAVQGVPEGARTASFIYSDGSVDRYGDTVNPDGWELAGYMANPVVLFGHDANSVENVIGKSISVVKTGTALVGTVEFMAAGINPVADTVYQMVKAGFLNSVSVGFRPLEFKQAKERERRGGIDFIKQELLEISVVPVPALPTALVQARAAGFDCSAVERLVRVGKKAEMKVKSLNQVGWLAYLIDMFWGLADEVGTDDDNSEVSARLAAALNELGQALLALTAEEVFDILSGEEDSDSTMPLPEGTTALGLYSLLRKSVKSIKPRQLPVNLADERKARAVALKNRLKGVK